MDDKLGAALSTYSDILNKDRQSLQWQRAVSWIEGIMFSQGRHYMHDILVSRIARDSSDNLSVVEEASKNIPKPTNDILGRYIETNIALLTENRPRPRVTPKSDTDEDVTAAELSELTLEYLWEALQMPEKHREIARLILHCGVCWMEIAYDPTVARRMKIPKTEVENQVHVTEASGRLVPKTTPVRVQRFDEQGRPIIEEQTRFGEIVANIISPFEIHIPSTHWWHDHDNGIGWVMREYYAPIENIKNKYSHVPRNKSGLTRAKGWNLNVLDKVKSENPMRLPMWWWERVTELVEGPGSSVYIGSPDNWEDYAVVRIFDRKPNSLWPKGRTIITVGDQVLYDSPKNVGARAYDPRWPKRWHPYVRFRWEPQPGSIWGRSLVSKLLPKLKRINQIDTSFIMWRRTVPIATWIAPKGTQVTENLWSGRPGGIWTYDARRTAGSRPEPVYPPPYPQAALEERAQQIAEMESIAGTEEVLRGQRPTGVNSAAMIDILRKQALMSRSSILQAWDESLQEEGSALLMETIRYIKDDPIYAEQLRILAREKTSRASIQTFSGQDLSDNVQVRVDTASLALVSKEAREAKVLEFLNVAPGLMSIPDISLRQAIIEELGFKKALTPQGSHIDRVKKMISIIKQNKLQDPRLIPMVEDDPYVMHELLVKEKQSEAFWDLSQDQQSILLTLIEEYRQAIEFREAQQLKLQMMMAEAGVGATQNEGEEVE
jgi:hypothetical protein